MFIKYADGTVVHVSISPQYRLRLLDGGYVYMAWHRYCGPTFYRDRNETRQIDDWYLDPFICRAVEWFQGRGERA